MRMLVASLIALGLAGCGSTPFRPPAVDCRLPVAIVQSTAGTAAPTVDVGVVQLPSGWYEQDASVEPLVKGARVAPSGNEYAYTTISPTGKGQLHLHSRKNASDRVVLEVAGQISVTGWGVDGVRVTFASGSRPPILVDPSTGAYRDDFAGGGIVTPVAARAYATLGLDDLGRPIIREGARGAGDVYIWDGTTRTVIGRALSPPDFDPAGAAFADRRLWLWTFGGELFSWTSTGGLTKQRLSGLPRNVEVIRVLGDCW